jgi:NADH-quinone oxidoreductase subunit H
MIDQVFVNLKRAILQMTTPLLPEWTHPLVAAMISIGAIALVAPAIMMYLTLYERKVIARMQNRLGPNRVGPYGLAQPLADGLKMLNKEDIVPAGADKLLHFLAPVLSVVPVIMVFAVLPFGRNMAAVDLNVGLLYFLAVSSVGSYAIFMGGWASRSKFSLLGAMRAVAQIISYEVPSVLAVVAVIMVTGTLSMQGIVQAQAERWFVLTPWGFMAAIIFFLSGTAETNRTPFDMPEGESEIVAGFHTEYSGMKFALWYMAEFLEAFAISAVTATLFFGGWHGLPIPMAVLLWVLALIVGSAQTVARPLRVLLVLAFVGASILVGPEPIPSWMWFLAKTYAFFFVLVWFRGTFPRLRADQLMGLAWKGFLPLSLVNILAAGVWVALPGLAGELASALLVVASYWLIVRINHPAALERRTYLFAE